MKKLLGIFVLLFTLTYCNDQTNLCEWVCSERFPNEKVYLAPPSLLSYVDKDGNCLCCVFVPVIKKPGDRKSLTTQTI